MNTKTNSKCAQTSAQVSSQLPTQAPNIHIHLPQQELKKEEEIQFTIENNATERLLTLQLMVQAVGLVAFLIALYIK